MDRDYRDVLIDQNVGLKRRIEVLEKANRLLGEAVAFTVRTLDLCRDPQANPLAKMCDRQRAEEMLRAALPFAPQSPIPADAGNPAGDGDRQAGAK